MGRNVVERLRRTEEFLYRIEDRASPYITYIGRTDLHGAPTNEPVWQIQRIIVYGDNREVTFANYGKFNSVWDLKHTYFPPPPAPSPPSNTGLPQEVDIYPGIHKFLDYVGPSTPGVEQLLMSYTVPIGKVLYLHKITLNCWQQTNLRIEVDGIQIAAFRNNQNGDGVYIWTPFRNVSQGLEIEVFGTVKSTPLAADLDVHLMTSEFSA